MILFIGVQLCSFVFGQTFYTDGEDLQDAVNAASPGDVFIVPNGSYKDFESSFTAIATASQPIIVKAETVGGVTLTGESHFVFKKAAHIILEGFVFDAQDDNTLVKLEGCHHIRITRNVFELETTESIKWVFIGGFWNDYTFEYQSHHNRVDHNIFKNKQTPGHYITIDGTSNEDDTDIRQSQYDRIDHNYFVNNGPRAANEQESIRIGWSEMSKSSGFTIVEHNLFENCDGDPEIISVKSCDNTIRYNTFRACYGTLSLRHGNRNRVEGNYFFGAGKANGTFTNSGGSASTIHTGGIRIYGTDHVIINNYMEGLQGTRWDAPIALTQGDAVDGANSSLSKHFRAERITIAYNTLVNNAYGIEIGFDNNGKYSKGLKDIVISNNLITGSQNSLINYMDGNHPGQEVSWFNNVIYPTGTAVLTSDGSSFSNSQVQVTDPGLAQTNGLWKPTSSTPSLPSGLTNLSVSKDIELQSRPSLSQVGADYLGQDTVLNVPLLPQDVGPMAWEISTALEFSPNVQFRVFPNPASKFLFLDQLSKSVESVSLFSLSGQKVLESEITEGSQEKRIELPLLEKGYYYIQLEGKGQYKAILICVDQQ
ncbi:MAG: T9SS type A sorting domain-containing protein [Bacteroidia bacterium]|nr:T9SS type A sorting domain-containing protein [Bacteroidia bacterium]